MKHINTSVLPMEVTHRQWEMERKIREELNDPDFLNKYTRKTLRVVMEALFPHVVMLNEANRAFKGMTKARMHRHLLGYAILHGWK